MRQKFAIMITIVGLNMISGPSFAHQCMLEGTDAKSVSQYNQCKADLSVAGMHKADHHDSQAGTSREDIQALQTENALLKRQIEQIKRQLFDLLKDL
jgi:hypothetical protein